MKTSSKSIKEISYRIFIGLFYLFVFAPVIILIIFSFNNNKYPTLPWSGFTLNWYRGLFSDTTMVEPLTNSLISASLVSLISLAIGFIGANYLFRLKGKSKNVLFGLGFAPALIPPLLLAVKFITYLKFVSLNPSLGTVIIFQAVFFTPIALILIYYTLTKIDPDIEAACYDLGGNFKHYITKVLLPMLKWNLLGVFLLIFAFSWDEFIISWFVSGFSETIPLKIWAMLKTQISPEINALGTIVLLISITLLIVAMILIRREISKDEKIKASKRK